MASCIIYRHSLKAKEIYGKWLVFRDYDKLNDTWKAVVMAMREDKLGKCRKAKCSTLFYNPVCAGPGPSTSGVICVYTHKDDMDDIGLKLIEVVKQDIRYKTNEDTQNFKYAHVGETSSIKTLYYNQGSPSFDLVADECLGTTRNKEDIWHINEVISPTITTLGPDYGWWILTLEYKELTRFWHLLKKKIEEGQLKAKKMVCPSKRRRSSHDEKPIFHVYTDEEHIKAVGSLLILEVCHDIKYERKSGYPHYRVLYWNDGAYAYEKISRKGITKNWRTGDTM